MKAELLMDVIGTRMDPLNMRQRKFHHKDVPVHEIFQPGRDEDILVWVRDDINVMVIGDRKNYCVVVRFGHGPDGKAAAEQIAATMFEDYWKSVPVNVPDPPDTVVGLEDVPHLVVKEDR